MNESNTWVLLGSGQQQAEKVGGGRMEEEKRREFWIQVKKAGHMHHPKFFSYPSLSLGLFRAPRGQSMTFYHDQF